MSVNVDRGVVVGNVTDKYRSKNPVLRWLMDGFLNRVTELYLEADPDTVLEVGCGEGDLSALLQKRKPASQNSDDGCKQE